MALEAGQHVLAGLVVRRHQIYRLDSGILHVFAHTLGGLVVLPGHRHEILMAAGTGDRRRAGVRADQKRARTRHGLVDGHHQVRPDDAGHDIDLVALHQPVGQLLGNVRLALVIDKNDLGVHAAKLAAGMFHGQIDRVLHLFADDTGTTGKRGHVADLDRIRQCRHRGGQRHGNGCRQNSFHCSLPRNQAV